MIKDNGDYQHHIHVFRGLAIILIVCAHTIPSLDWTANPVLARVIDAFVNQSSIFFFFIAGYLFQYLSKKFVLRKYALQKLKTVIVPYLILSIPAIFIFTVLTKRTVVWDGFYLLPLWEQVALFLLTGKHLAPLWFVPTITLFYFFAPVFLWIDRKFRYGYWIIIPLIYLSTMIGRGGQLGPIDKAIYLLPIYMLGMAFSQYREKALLLVGRWWPLLLLLSGVSFMGYVFDLPRPPFYQMPMKASFVLLMTWVLYNNHSVFGNKLDYVAEVSFGIFFIHAYVISLVKIVAVYAVSGKIYLGEGGDVIPGNIISFAAYVIIVTVITVSVIWFGKRIFGRYSRMVIGA
jgi:probable poly-beta-1,6-N-acetyl-D-glucosamine export protein